MIWQVLPKDPDTRAQVHYLEIEGEIWTVVIPYEGGKPPHIAKCIWLDKMLVYVDYNNVEFITSAQSHFYLENPEIFAMERLL